MGTSEMNWLSQQVYGNDRCGNVHIALIHMTQKHVQINPTYMQVGRLSVLV